MKILYLSDEYGKHNRGTKHSIFEGLRSRGYNITFMSVHSSGRNRIAGQRLLRTIKTQGYDWVWVAHSKSDFIGCTLEDIHAAGARVLGFGFSDPYTWDPARLGQYDAYMTNHFETFRSLRDLAQIPVGVIATAGDSSFHRDLRLARRTDILCIGLGRHPRFDPPDYRISVMQHIHERFQERSIAVFGTGWGTIPNGGMVKGRKFLEALNQAKVSLDLQQPHAPLAHRMFESLLCGTPVVTRRRSEVDDLFGDWKGILTYDEPEDLCERIEEVLSDPDWDARSRAVREYSVAHHDIGNRLDGPGGLVEWFKGLQER